MPHLFPAPGDHHSILCPYELDYYKKRTEMESHSHYSSMPHSFHWAQYRQDSSMWYQVSEFTSEEDIFMRWPRKDYGTKIKVYLGLMLNGAGKTCAQ